MALPNLLLYVWLLVRKKFNCLKGQVSDTFRLLTLELLGTEKTTTIAHLLETVQNILMTLLAGSQVNDRCPLGFMLTFVSRRISVHKLSL